MINPEEVQKEQPAVAPLKPEPKVIQSISIEVKENGQMTLSAFIYGATEGGTEVKKPMSIREQRGLLRDVLDFINDRVAAEFTSIFVDQMLQQKVKPKGFRLGSIKDFLTGK